MYSLFLMTKTILENTSSSIGSIEYMAIEITSKEETASEVSDEYLDPLEMKNLGTTRFNSHLDIDE